MNKSPFFPDIWPQSEYEIRKTQKDRNESFINPLKTPALPETGKNTHWNPRLLMQCGWLGYSDPALHVLKAKAGNWLTAEIGINTQRMWQSSPAATLSHSKKFILTLEVESSLFFLGLLEDSSLNTVIKNSFLFSFKKLLL